jgi:hypothetical protein
MKTLEYYDQFVELHHNKFNEVLVGLFNKSKSFGLLIFQVITYLTTIWALRKRKTKLLLFIILLPILKFCLSIAAMITTFHSDSPLLSYLGENSIKEILSVVFVIDHEIFCEFLGKRFNINLSTCSTLCIVYYLCLLCVRQTMMRESVETKEVTKKKSNKINFPKTKREEMNQQKRVRVNQKERQPATKPQQGIQGKGNAKEICLVRILNCNTEPKPDQFFHACLYGHNKVIRHLLGHFQFDLSDLEPVSGFTAFHLACAGGHLSIVQQLMSKYGKDTCRDLINREGQTGLECAVESGRIEIVKTILNSISQKNLR